ncbi:MAG: hypothetical protein ACKN81_10230 [Pirellulaceae bacterium]
MRLHDSFSSLQCRGGPQIDEADDASNWEATCSSLADLRMVFAPDVFRMGTASGDYQDGMVTASIQRCLLGDDATIG